MGDEAAGFEYDFRALIERARAAGVTHERIAEAIEALIAARAKHRGRPRRLDGWTDPDVLNVVRLAAIVAQGWATPYAAAVRIAAGIDGSCMTSRNSTRDRLARKYRKYFPVGLEKNHALNLLLAPGFKWGPPVKIPEDITFDFAKLKAKAAARRAAIIDKNSE